MNVYGINPSIALKNILIRKEERLNNSMKSTKKIKSALVVQGGGMRGVFSAGALIALEKLGFAESFDVIYGSSGGAVNASYFLAKQSPFGASIYYEDINNSKVINPFRIKKIFDMDYVFDEVVTKIKPLNVSNVVKSGSEFYIFLTKITGSFVRFKPETKNFIELLKASCALPVYYNKAVPLNGSCYIDGGICKAIPIEEAINDGSTDILVILTHPIKFKRNISFFEKFIVKKILSKFNSKLFDLYLTGFENYNYAFDISIGKRKINRKVNITTIVPDDDFKVTRLTKNENLLKKSAIDGAKKIFDLFNYDCDMDGILEYN